MHISSFGGSTFMLPAAAAIAVWLLAGGAWRMALWWCGSFAFALTIVAATKIAFVGWGIGIDALHFSGISGHAMRASAVYPVIFYLALQRSPRPVKTSGVLLGLAIALLIGVSRLVLHTHSVSEVVAGWLLGGALGIGFIMMSARWPKPLLNRKLIGLSLLVLLPTAYAKPVPTEAWINAVALYLSGHDKPYTWPAGESSRAGSRLCVRRHITAL